MEAQHQVSSLTWREKKESNPPRTFDIVGAGKHTDVSSISSIGLEQTPPETVALFVIFFFPTSWFSYFREYIHLVNPGFTFGTENEWDYRKRGREKDEEFKGIPRGQSREHGTREMTSDCPIDPPEPNNSYSYFDWLLTISTPLKFHKKKCHKTQLWYE